eukprot:CAMPEP_0178379138 /NCGR_PEP_ID=MMETSP0689_2-20121128/4785_1 /TAXON_ID=160604 /ORGANISM="Amphidinium massartii, Strain CS-259" /LENGTH=562 /DNA_ID=CAMNT_0019999225 /DNA_START=14 /DNA_END=1698 /DNA_ORIENTATION=-
MSRGTLELFKLQVGAGPCDPALPQIAAEVLEKLGAPEDTTVEQLKDNYGGMNLGVWELRHKSSELDLIMKSVKSERTHANLPTETEVLVQTCQRFPCMVTDASLCFPTKIFMCYGPDGRPQADLMVMRRAKGEQLSTVISQKIFEGRVEDLMDIVEKVGTCLGRFHSNYDGLQHGDLQPSNIYYDEESGEVNLIDLGRIGVSTNEQHDLVHFIKSLDMLSKSYGHDLTTSGMVRLKAGYAKGYDLPERQQRAPSKGVRVATAADFTKSCAAPSIPMCLKPAPLTVRRRVSMPSQSPKGASKRASSTGEARRSPTGSEVATFAPPLRRMQEGPSTHHMMSRVASCIAFSAPSPATSPAGPFAPPLSLAVTGRYTAAQAMTPRTRARNASPAMSPMRSAPLRTCRGTSSSSSDASTQSPASTSRSSVAASLDGSEPMSWASSALSSPMASSVSSLVAPGFPRVRPPPQATTGRDFHQCGAASPPAAFIHFRRPSGAGVEHGPGSPTPGGARGGGAGRTMHTVASQQQFVPMLKGMVHDDHRTARLRNAAPPACHALKAPPLSGS